MTSRIRFHGNCLLVKIIMMIIKIHIIYFFKSFWFCSDELTLVQSSRTKSGMWQRTRHCETIENTRTTNQTLTNVCTATIRPLRTDTYYEAQYHPGLFWMYSFTGSLKVALYLVTAALIIFNKEIILKHVFYLLINKKKNKCIHRKLTRK